MARMLARFAGKCSVCGCRIAEGQDIDYDRETRKVRCLDCADPSSSKRGTGNPLVSSSSDPMPHPFVRSWSAYQAAIFSDVATSTGHTVVRARAGTGKTTTIVEALRHVPAGKSVLMVAFNKKIAEELQGRAPSGVQVKTLHGFGFSALMGVRKVRLDSNRVRSYLETKNPEWTAERCGAICKATGLAKGMLATTTEEIDDIIDRFSIDVPEFARAEFCQNVLATLAWCKRDTGTCDFDDMVWLPVVLETRVQQYDYVFIDETQDLNRAQIELALRAVKRDGRIIAVGDDRQAIYGFRGADERAMPALIERLAAKVLPLSVTYRCGKTIVDVAREIVSDYEAAPTNADGCVSHVGDETMKRDAKPGDFVISRANAPLIGLCLDFLKRGIRANIAGRDVGASLLSLVTKSGATTIPELNKYVDEWATAECARLAAKKPPRDSQSVEDRAECISALCEGAKTVAEVRERIESLFSDKDDSARVMLTTTHKAKGLERDRCWILTETFRPRRSTEEANLWYVAVTRAKTDLFLVGSAAPVAPQPSPESTIPEPATVNPTPSAEPSPASEPVAMATVQREAATLPVERRPMGLMPQSDADAKAVRFNGRCACGKAHSVLAEGRQCHRHYGWFWHTPKGAMAEDNRGTRLSFWLSCDCGKLVRLFKVDGSYNAGKKCDGRCMSARGHVCDCQCGGRNHGAAHG